MRNSTCTVRVGFQASTYDQALSLPIHKIIAHKCYCQSECLFRGVNFANGVWISPSLFLLSSF